LPIPLFLRFFISLEAVKALRQAAGEKGPNMASSESFIGP